MNARDFDFGWLDDQQPVDEYSDTLASLFPDVSPAPPINASFQPLSQQPPEAGSQVAHDTPEVDGKFPQERIAKRRPKFHIDLPDYRGPIPGPSGSVSAVASFARLSPPHYTLDTDDFGQVTPGMNPPSQMEYFEGVTPGVPGMRYDMGFLSPQIDSEINNFNQDFARHLFQQGPAPEVKLESHLFELGQVPKVKSDDPSFLSQSHHGSHNNLASVAQSLVTKSAVVVPSPNSVANPGPVGPPQPSFAVRRPQIMRTHSSPNFDGDRHSLHSSKKKRTPKGAVCTICDKYISRDLTRHMRIHNDVGRFQCVYPKHMCNHKTQYFNRPYDYKKHLLHMHFKFDDPKSKAAHTLTDKLPSSGQCQACGAKYIAKDWLDNHVLSTDNNCRCPFVEPARAIAQGEYRAP